MTHRFLLWREAQFEKASRRVEQHPWRYAGLNALGFVVAVQLGRWAGGGGSPTSGLTQALVAAAIIFALVRWVMPRWLRRRESRTEGRRA